VEVPEGVNREAVNDARGPGCPTGLFTVYNGLTINSQAYTFHRARSAGAITLFDFCHEPLTRFGLSRTTRCTKPLARL